jgi:hypothetical protein
MADPNTLGGVDKAYLLAAITPRHLRASKRTVPGRVHPLPMSGSVEGAISTSLRFLQNSNLSSIGLCV